MRFSSPSPSATLAWGIIFHAFTGVYYLFIFLFQNYWLFNHKILAGGRRVLHYLYFFLFLPAKGKFLLLNNLIHNLMHHVDDLFSSGRRHTVMLGVILVSEKLESVHAYLDPPIRFISCFIHFGLFLLFETLISWRFSLLVQIRFVPTDHKDRILGMMIFEHLYPSL